VIAVLGAGTWGTALAIVLAKTVPEEKVLFWGRSCYTKHLPNVKLPNNVEFTTDLIATVQRATDLLVVVPSSAFTDLIQTIMPYIKKSRIAWATKGLDAKTGKFFSQIMLDLLGDNFPIAILVGPSFAKEVIEGLPTSVIVACRNTHQDQLFAEDLIKRLHSKNFIVYLCNDLIGAQLGGVLKNILAVASGIYDGLGFGANAKAALIARGLAEGLRLVDQLGGKRQTLMGLSGVGDIFLSCSDNQSRNRRFGLLLASGLSLEQAKLKIGQVVEAVDNVQKLYQLAINYKVDMPITFQMWQIIVQKMPLQQAIEDLFTREPQIE